MDIELSREFLSELFGIEIVADAGFEPPALRDHRKWTTDDSDKCAAMRQAGASFWFIGLVIGHSPETVRRWSGTLR